VIERGSFDPTRELLDRLYRAACALCGSPDDAEDLVQETFARVLARPRLLRRTDPAPYLMRSLRNTYLTGLRTAGRRPRTVALPSEETTTISTSLARPEVAAEQQATLDAITALPERFRSALVAVDLLGLSYAEAAVALGVREPTITSRLFRARGRVARALRADRDESSPRREGFAAGGVLVG
jgi:RNA polymerase sigma-70 factor, ECF subfamily